MCFIQFLSSRSGKSSRAWAPRLSVRLTRRSPSSPRPGDQVVELQRLDQIGVPDQRAVGDVDVGDAGEHFVDQLVSLPPAPRRCGTRRNCSASPSASWRAAPRSACRPWRCGSCRAATAPDRRNPSAAPAACRPGVRISAQRMRGGAAEHHEIDQRIRAEPVGAMHRDAGRFAERHQAGHDGVGIAVLLGQRLAVIVRGDAAHVVVHGRDTGIGSRVRSTPAKMRADSEMPGSRSCRTSDRDGRGAGRCGPSSCRRRGPRGFRSSSRARPRRARRGPWRTARSAP